MTDIELTLNQLAEVTTTAISKSRKPETFDMSKKIAKEGGTVAKSAKKDIEKRIGQKVVSKVNAGAKELLEVERIEILNNKSRKNNLPFKKHFQ